MASSRHSLARNRFWFGVNVVAVLPVLWAIYLLRAAPHSSSTLTFATGASQRVILFTGKMALIFLLLSLACTPLARILGWRQAITVRKSLGLWGFGFALFHGLFFMGGKALFFTVAAWRDLWNWYPTIFVPIWLKMPYVAYGAMALCLLIPLALTSNRLAMHSLGKGWKWLHRLVYLAVPLALFHYWQRALFLTMTPSVGEPENRQLLFFALVAGGLLLMRIPTVRRRCTRLVSSLKTILSKEKLP